MLTQNFKSADALGIPEEHREALMKTLVLLETGKLHHVPDEGFSDDLKPKFSGAFNMCNYHSKHNCGTVACIAGTAMLIADVDFIHCSLPSGLSDLFFPPMSFNWNDITPEEASTALRSYLTTGDPRWDLAVAA